MAASPAHRLGCAVEGHTAQIIFSFAGAIGMLPLTGTSSAEHMREDLASIDLTLPAEIVRAIEAMAG